jgi:hypothetical protein
MARRTSSQHASAIATATASVMAHDPPTAAFELERLGRLRLAERLHDDLVQNLAAALLLLRTVQVSRGSEDRLGRGLDIICDAFSSGRRALMGSLEPIDRPLSFTLPLLLEAAGLEGSVSAPTHRLAREREVALFDAVRDALALSRGGRPIAVRLVVTDGWVIGGVRGDIEQLDLLAAALEFRLGLLGGDVRPLARGGGVALRLPLDHSA